MNIQPFELERFFARYEFSAQYLLSSSDCESQAMSELLALADEEMAAEWEGLRLGYTESRGHPQLLQAIAEMYPGLGHENVLVAAPEETIYLFMRALLQSGDHVVCTFPGYQSLYAVAEAIGCTVDLWQPHEARGWYFDPQDLRDLLRPNTSLVVVNFPHNPTGYLPNQGDFEAVIDMARQNGAYLLSDEMYRFLELSEVDRLPTAVEQYERAFSLSGLSKAYGLPGLRIGWLAGWDTHLLERVGELKDYTTICSSAPSEILAIIALRARAALLGPQISRLQRNLAVLDRFFDDYSEFFEWQRPLAGSVSFPRMTTVEDTYEFCEELAAEAGILLVPSQVFQYGDRHVRVGFGRENLPEVVARFCDYLDERFR